MYRNKTIKIRVSDDELSQLRDQKTERDLAVWIRGVCLGKPVRNHARKQADPRLLQRLTWIGKELTHIGQVITSADYGHMDKVKVLVELTRIRKYIMRSEHDCEI